MDNTGSVHSHLCICLHAASWISVALSLEKFITLVVFLTFVSKMGNQKGTFFLQVQAEMGHRNKVILDGFFSFFLFLGLKFMYCTTMEP